MLPWLRISIQLEPDAIESIKALFLEHDLSSVIIRSCAKQQDKPCLELIAHLANDEQTAARIESLERELWHYQAFNLCHISDLQIVPLTAPPAEDGEPSSLENYLVGKTWQIQWNESPASGGKRDAARHQLILRHGSAFGTGLHPSTHLILTLLEQQSVAGKVVLDVGTGSGILTLACAKMQAGSILAIDIDPKAVTDVAANITLNPDLITCPIETKTAALSAELGVFDLVLANLPGTIMQQNASLLNAALRPSGILLLSGYRTPQMEETHATFAACGLEKNAKTSDNEWISTSWQKPKNQTVGSTDRGRSKQIIGRNTL